MAARAPPPAQLRAPAPGAAGDAAGALPVRVRTVRSLLQHTPLSAFTAPEKGVLTVNANVTAANAFKQLLSRGVQSAPVVAATDQPHPSDPNPHSAAAGAPAAGAGLAPPAIAAAATTRTATRTGSVGDAYGPGGECIGFFELSDAVRYVVDAYDRAEAIALVARAYDRDRHHTRHRDRMALPLPVAHTLDVTQPKAGASADVGGADAKSNTAAAGDAVNSAANAKATGASASASVSASVNEAMDELFADTRTGAAGAGTNATAGQLCRAHPFVALPESASLLDAVALLCGTTHRVCVLDARGAVVNVISQSDVVRFLYHSLPHIVPNECQRTVQDWHMGTGVHALHVMPHTARAIDVFRRMCDRHVSCVVLTDERGAYVDFAQPSDLKIFLSLFTTPRSHDAAADIATVKPAANPIAKPAGATHTGAQAAVSSALFEAPICTVLREVRELEHRGRVVKGSGSARDAMAMTLSSGCAPAFADIVTRLATTRSHVLCLTERLDESTDSTDLALDSAGGEHGRRMPGHGHEHGHGRGPVQVPVMVCSLGDVLRAVLRYVPPSAAEYFKLQTKRLAQRAAAAAAAASAAANAHAHAQAQAQAQVQTTAQTEPERGGAIDSAVGSGNSKASTIPTSIAADSKVPPAAVAPPASSAAAAAALEALRLTAAQLATAAQGLSAALQAGPRPLPDRERDAETEPGAGAAALASVHSAYAAMTTAAASVAMQSAGTASASRSR